MIKCDLRKFSKIKRHVINSKRFFISQKKPKRKIRKKQFRNGNVVYLTPKLLLFLRNRRSFRELPGWETPSPSALKTPANKEVKKHLVTIKLGKIVWFTVSLSLSAFLFCVSWSLVFDFSETTRTECHVANFLPSVSAAFGRGQPQKFVWNSSVTVQTACRAIFFYAYCEQFAREKLLTGKCGVKIYALVAYFFENIGLVTLSYWDSTENLEIHKLAFTVFLVASLPHMFLSYKITKNYTNFLSILYHKKSLRWKYYSMITNVIFVALVLYLYYRHNKYCEPFVYSIFAATEYVMVFSNLTFHASMAYDFVDRSLLLNSDGLRIVQSTKITV